MVYNKKYTTNCIKKKYIYIYIKKLHTAKMYTT